MKARQLVVPAAALAVLGGLLALIPARAAAHCDTMGGPVVITAQQALDKGNVTPVLKWVKPDNEAEVRAAFKQALAVRKQGKAAKELADRSFFETLVRLHRAGEGASYTGLKDTPVEPIIAKADAAIAQGSIDDVTKLLTEAMSKRLREKFDLVSARAREADKNVEAGREYVEAYVDFTHYVERLHSDITAGTVHGAEHAPQHEEE